MSLHYSIPSIEELSKANPGHRADGLWLHPWILLVSPENKSTLDPRKCQQRVLSDYFPSTHLQTRGLDRVSPLLEDKGKVGYTGNYTTFLPTWIRRHICACLKVSNARYCHSRPTVTHHQWSGPPEEGQGGGEHFTPHGHPHHTEVRGL